MAGRRLEMTSKYQETSYITTRPKDKKPAPAAADRLRHNKTKQNVNNNNNKQIATLSLAVDRSTERWFRAVLAADQDALIRLLHRGVDPNITAQSGWAAVHFAAYNGLRDVITLLVTCPSCLLDLAGPGGITALGLASQQGHVDIVSLLIGSGRCDINSACVIADSCDVTPLHLAAQHGHVEACRVLVQSGANVNAAMTTRETRGVTALHVAVTHNRLEVMDLLLGQTGDVTRTPPYTNETYC